MEVLEDLLAVTVVLATWLGVRTVNELATV
jgi:hypothetical protein